MSVVTENRVKGHDVKVIPSSAFSFDTPPHCVKAHFLTAVVAPRGYGKGQITTSFLKQMPIDRLFMISPSAKSNKSLCDALKGMLNSSDIYEDVMDNGASLDDIVLKVEKERDDYEEYHRRKKEKHKDRLLSSCWEEDNIFIRNQPPKHKWNGKAPFCALWIDDAMSSSLMQGKGLKRLCALAIKHRHCAPFEQGSALGLSIILNVQAWRSCAGALPPAIRSNCTQVLLGRTRSKMDRESLAESFSSECSKDEFLTLLDHATSEPHGFLMVDTVPKAGCSMYRKNLDTYLHLQNSSES